MTVAAELETTTIRCSFCAKEETEVSKIIAGPGIYICDQCVQACNTILAEDVSTQLPIWDSMTDEQILAHLPRVAQVGAQVERNLRSWIDQLRQRGVTWSRIGAALDMTRQSAWGRFSGEE
ncbi:MAG: ClpX C4-type zinc finger protein [Jatrophihabitantaceae bacterium]